jgi:ribA/ribD-fused uncharacterized protein
MTIDNFRGQYYFLSNFYEDDLYFIQYDGLFYNNAEAAFQSAKLLDKVQRRQFCNLNAPDAKRLGRRVQLRPDWEQVKDNIMYEIIKSKFSIKHLREMLLATGEAILIEGNTWNDTYWGMCRGKGKNMLGKILMRVREELKS